MTYRTNINATGRDFYFAPFGNNELSGYSLENAVADPAAVMALLSALSPPPSGSEPASMNASVTGTYTDNIVLIDFISAACRFASISLSSGDNLRAASQQTSEWGALLNFGAGSCYVIDAKIRHRSIVNAMVVFGTGITVTGVCDDVFCELVIGELQAEGSVMISHTATTPTTIVYDYKSIVFFEKSQTFINYNPVSGSSETIVNTSSITMNPGSDTAGSVIANVESGDLVINGGVLKAETFANVKNAARLVVSADVVAGDTNASDTAGVVYKPIALYLGNITLTDTAVLFADIDRMDGDLNVGIGTNASVEIEFLVGDITVDGTLFCNITNHIGALTVNGALNGIINGTRYGNSAVQTSTRYLNDEGDQRGVIGAFDDIMTVAGIDDQGVTLPLLNVGSPIIQAGDQTAFIFNGAAAGNFLRIQNQFDFYGNEAFLLGTTPLDVVEYAETFTDATDQLLTTSFQTMVSGTLVNQYREDTSVAEGLFQLVNNNNKAKVVEYAITANDAAPTEIFFTTVPARKNSVDGTAVVEVDDTSQTTLDPGETIELKVRQQSGSNVIVAGTNITTTLKISQNAGIQNVAQAVEDISANTTLDTNRYFRATGGTIYTLPACSDKFDRNKPFGFFFKNVLETDITLNVDGSDVINTIDGTAASLIVKAGEAFFLVCASLTEWDINGSYDLWPQKPKRFNVLTAAHYLDQVPAGKDIPLQMLFGAAQFGSSDPVELDVSGNIKINEADQYNVSTILHFGRTGAGGVSVVYFRTLVNAVQVGDPHFVKLNDSNEDLPASWEQTLDLGAGDVLTIEIVRDSAGNNSGCVETGTSSTGWGIAPSAAISLSRNRLVHPV